MPRKLLLTKIARQDRRRIRAWYRQPGSGAAAQTLLHRLEAAISALTNLSVAHRAGPRPDSRLLIIQRHRVVYHVLPDRRGRPGEGDILILRIYGPGQSGD